MEAAKFTPGPWNVVLRGERGTFHIPEAQRHESAAADTDGEDGHSVSSANARLIKASPAMYAALRELLDRCDREIADTEDVPEIVSARAVLLAASS